MSRRMSVRDGGPVFPVEIPASDYQIDGEPIAKATYMGMSLLDWFAGQALRGLLSHPGSLPKRLADPELFGKAAYEAAAAAMDARKKFYDGRKQTNEG